VFGGEHECLSIQTGQRYIDSVRQNAILIAVELHPETPESLECALPKLTAHVRTRSGVFRCQLCGKPESDDKWNWKRTWAQTPLLSSTEQERSQWRTVISASSRDERTDAFGTVNFVPADTDQINARIAQRIASLSKSLGGVYVEVRRVVREDCTVIDQWLLHARFVVHVHERDQ
jgi:ribosomal protein L37AE/L43A